MRGHKSLKFGASLKAGIVGWGYPVRRVETIHEGGDAVEVTSNDEGSSSGGESGRKDVLVETGSLVLLVLCRGIDPHEGDGGAVKGEVQAQDAAFLNSRVEGHNRNVL
jgi:hypothetical protein